MYTLGRDNKLSWDSEESFPPKKLITTHFNKAVSDPHTFALREIPTNTIHHHEKSDYLPKSEFLPKHESHSFYLKSNPRFPDDGTRASSPIHVQVSSSPLIPHSLSDS